MKKSQERPIEKPERTKEDIDRGIAIRESFFSTIQQEIVHTQLQMTFCSPESAEYRYHAETLKILYNQKNSYGK